MWSSFSACCLSLGPVVLNSFLDYFQTKSQYNRTKWGPPTQAWKAMLLEHTQPYLFIKICVCMGHYQLSPSTELSQTHFPEPVAPASSSFWFKRLNSRFILSPLSKYRIPLHIATPKHVSVHLGQFRIAILFKEKKSSQMFVIHPRKPLSYTFLWVCFKNIHPVWDPEGCQLWSQSISSVFSLVTWQDLCTSSALHELVLASHPFPLISLRVTYRCVFWEDTTGPQGI